MLNVITCFQFPVLEKIAFPGKKTFGNLERNVVEKRQKETPQRILPLFIILSTHYWESGMTNSRRKILF